MLTPREEEPIVACATGQVSAAVAILRISGQGTFERLNRCLSAQWGKQKVIARQMLLTTFKDPETNETIDEPLVVFFPGPHSYTGQDTVELFLHGGPYIVRRSLEVLQKLGFRLADPGEFTRRAFLNGKMDLTTAEGIKELVACTDENQWMAARQLASGSLAQIIEDLRGRLVDAMALLEASIDFPDEKETSAVGRDQVVTAVSHVGNVLRQLSDSYNAGAVARQGLKIAIIGPPNSGKSTLLNALLGRDRAIVSDIAGTTRDYIEETCLIDGRKFVLFDTAGVRVSNDAIERMGIERSMEIAESADCIVLMCTASELNQHVEDLETMTNLLSKKTLLHIASKADSADCSVAEPWKLFSTRSQLGLSELKNELCQIVDRLVQPIVGQAFLSTERHLHAVEQALSCINTFFLRHHEGAYDEMLAFELLECARSLGHVVGNIGNDDLLETIFSKFCVGK